MTANMIKGKGFRGALRYNLEKVGKGVAEVLDHAFVEVSEKSIMKEIQMIKALRPNLQKFFYHTSINFPPSEDLTNVKMIQVGQDYLKESGFTQHQYIMFRHHDADHPHLHILVNRIGYDGRVLSDSNDFARCEKVLRDLEIKYCLTQVISSRQARERAMTKDELEMMKRTNTPSQKMQMQIIIRDILQARAKLTCGEFIRALESKGINILFNQATTGYVSGISYRYQDLISTGAKLGNDFKWTSIKNNIDYEQERDRTAIREANARTESRNLDSGSSNLDPNGNQKSIPQFRNENKASYTGNKRSGSHPRQSSEKRDGGQHKFGPFKQGDFGGGGIFQAKPESFNLAALLDGNSHGNNRGVDNQSDLGASYELTRKKRKKRKRRI
jgi:hypothetical protein